MTYADTRRHNFDDLACSVGKFDALEIVVCLMIIGTSLLTTYSWLILHTYNRFLTKIDYKAPPQMQDFENYMCFVDKNVNLEIATLGMVVSAFMLTISWWCTLCIRITLFDQKSFCRSIRKILNLNIQLVL